MHFGGQANDFRFAERALGPAAGEGHRLSGLSRCEHTGARTHTVESLLIYTHCDGQTCRERELA